VLEIRFVEIKTGDVNYAVTGVSRVRYVTPSEIGFDIDGRRRSAAFPQTEQIEIAHKTDSPVRTPLVREMTNA
jgi:hypothetical protein